MTKKLDPEEKRKRAILTRMANQGRLGDYLSTLTEAQRDEANRLLNEMAAKRFIAFDDDNHKAYGTFASKKEAVEWTMKFLFGESIRLRPRVDELELIDSGWSFVEIEFVG